MEMIDRAVHDGDGCLTATDSSLPSVTDEPGKRRACRCGRMWGLREVAGFVVWQQV